MPMSVRFSLLGFFFISLNFPKSLGFVKWGSLKNPFLILFVFVFCLIQIALVLNQSPQENLTLAKVVLIKKLVLLPQKALTQVFYFFHFFSQLYKILNFVFVYVVVVVILCFTSCSWNNSDFYMSYCLKFEVLKIFNLLSLCAVRVLF